MNNDFFLKQRFWEQGLFLNKAIGSKEQGFLKQCKNLRKQVLAAFSKKPSSKNKDL